MADLIYNDFLDELHQGNIDLNSDTFVLILLADTYTPDATDHDLADVSANEVANGSGYTTGGQSLTVSYDETSGTVTFDADDLVWNSATFTARYALIYDDTHAEDLLAFLLDFSENKTGQGDTFTVRFNASGIYVGAQA